MDTLNQEPGTRSTAPPSQLYERFVSRLRGVQSLSDIRDVCVDLCLEYGFEQYLFHTEIRTSLVNPEIGYLVGGVRADSITGASEAGPVGGWLREAPQAWLQGLEGVSTEPGLIDFPRGCWAHGLRYGAVVPTFNGNGDAANLCLATRRRQREVRWHIASIMPELHLLAPYLQRVVLRAAETQAAQPLLSVELTRREAEALRWSAEGKSTAEIAAIVQIKEATVNFHIKNAITKLGVRTRQHAIARAVSLGKI